MASSRRVRRRQRRPHPFVVAAFAALIAVGVVAFVGTVVGHEIEHRLDHSWHYERVALTDCSDIGSGFSDNDPTYDCTFATVPPLPIAIAPYLTTGSNDNRAPTSDKRWVHVVNGEVTGIAGQNPLWLLLFLLIPLFIVMGFVSSIRAAKRAGRRWRDPASRQVGRTRRMVRTPKGPPAGGSSATPF